MAYIYIIECEDFSLYTGITKDIRARLKMHAKGTASKYTRSRKFRRLRALWTCSSYGDAARLEYAIKQIPRGEKLKLIENPFLVSSYFHKLSDAYYEPCDTLSDLFNE